MRRIFAMLTRIASSESTVLLEGETGTGKGLIAETINLDLLIHLGGNKGGLVIHLSGNQQLLGNHRGVDKAGLVTQLRGHIGLESGKRDIYPAGYQAGGVIQRRYRRQVNGERRAELAA